MTNELEQLQASGRRRFGRGGYGRGGFDRHRDFYGGRGYY